MLYNMELFDKTVYDIVPDTQSILMTLVDNINSNETFQKHVIKLDTSEITKDRKKAIVIKDTIKNIKIFNTKFNPLFLAKDIGILLGISHINIIVKKFEKEEKIIGYITQPNNKIKKVIFLTRHGLYRCFFTSRSPLAKLFRKFICNLIDHMITEEAEIMKKLSTVFQVENPQLIKDGMTDLQIKLAEFEKLYLEEQKKNKLLKDQSELDYQLLLETKIEKTDVEIVNSFNMMHIEQLKQEKIQYQEKLKDMHDEYLNDDDVIATELQIFKKKFMKPLQIYIINPTYFNKLLLKEKKNCSELHTTVKNISAEINISDDSDAESNNHYTITLDQVEIWLEENESYTKNFNNIGNTKTKLESDEILLYVISLSKNVLKNSNLVHVGVHWVCHKKHFENVKNNLRDSCNYAKLQKITIYKTSFDEIGEIASDEFINLDK
jgi:prophage antirepressor-like protein